jgi:CheY-like chemotaxis protein
MSAPRRAREIRTESLPRSAPRRGAAGLLRPAPRGGPLVPRLHTPAAEAAMDRKKILLVDDSSTVLLMERMILSKSQYDVVTAKDGQEGVEKALAERPDLILMDVVMPRMDGYEACRRIRQQEDTKAIPVIMVTTRGELQSVETGYASGCTDYVTKPINGLELLAKVKSCLGQ